MPSVFRRLWYLLRRSRHEADLREEIETHRLLRQARLEREGLSPAAAAQASRVALGNVTLAREDVRRVWYSAFFDESAQDLRIAIRGLLKSPSFSVVAIGTLALGIGANTALFSIFNSLLLRTLPVREPQALVLVQDGQWTYPIWEAVRDHEREIFDGTFAFANASFDMSRGGQADPVAGAYVSGRMFDVLGLVPERGRLLGPDDDRNGADTSVAVISHRFWQQHFAGADDVVGRSVSLQRVPFTVVGVMPPEFTGADVGRVTDVMIPFAAEPSLRGEGSALTRRLVWWIEIMGRLKPGQTIEQATAALQAVQPQIRAAALPDRPGGFLTDPLTLAPAATGLSALRTRFEAPLRVMLVTVGLVLLIACANIASLLLARSLARQRELSVRLALGASRWRLARLLLVESLIIAVAGAALGLILASWGADLLVRQIGTWRSTVSLDLSLDWRVLGFATLLAGTTAITAGLAPALGVKRVAPGDALRSSGRTIAGDRRLTLRGGLVVVQIALSLVLLIGAGLFLRTFAALSHAPLGFSPDNLSVVTLDLGSSAVPAAGRPALLDRIRTAVTGAPGVRSVGLSVITPISGSGWNGMVGTAGKALDRRNMTWINAVSPDWFSTMGIPRLAGRDFDTRDARGATKVAIVNETFARRFLAAGQPVGQAVRVGVPGDEADYQVVGLVTDALYRSLREGMVPTMFVPFSQEESIRAGVTLTVAAGSGGRAAAERAAQDALRTVDPAIGFTLLNFDQFVRGAVAQERLVAMLSGFFGALALVLAAIGLYGVVAHSVSLRRTEIGVRMALGARSAGIVMLIVRRVAVMLAFGAAIGVTLSVWLFRFAQTLLFSLDARDPLTFALGFAVLAGAAGAAAWLPARRAARVDPATVLREG